MKIKNWIDIVRCEQHFNLIPLNLKNETVLSSAFYGGSGGVETSYEQLYMIEDVPSDFVGVPPSFMFVTNPQSFTDDDLLPHMEEPAAAQSASNLMFVWTSDFLLSERRHKKRLHRITLHRDDGFPAVVELINFRKHYYHGELHRKGNNPAITAERIMVHWYEDGKAHRTNGPTNISITGYKEWWKEGKFKGYKLSGYTTYWKDPTYSVPEDHLPEDVIKFLSNLKGTTNIFENRFFSDPQDELCYITEFGDKPGFSPSRRN